MNINQMKEIKNCRENLVGFLHLSDIKNLNILFDDYYDVDHKSFDQICDEALSLYSEKIISNKKTTNIFEILACENTTFRIESHRFENHSIFEYNNGSYIFLKKGSRKEFSKLNSYIAS